MIVAQGVSKYYYLGENVIKALDNVSLKVEDGDFVSIMGPSGSGKSTLMHLLGALDTPTSGDVLLDGINLKRLNDTELSMVRRKKIGFIFQVYNLIPDLNTIQNVMIPIWPERDISKETKIRKAVEILKKVGLGERLMHKPSQLSGGETLRVAIARALINDPAIIIGDEPTGSLDSKTAEVIMSLLRGLNREERKTVVIVTHNQDLLRPTDRIFYMKDGHLIRKEGVSNV
jgi:putative ABC transport system ATP-binding protein